MLALVAVPLLLAPLSASQDAGAPPPVVAVAAPAATDPHEAGRAALAAAARRQRGETPRAAPSALHGRFHVTAQAEDGSQYKVEVERWYTRSPERLLTHRREANTGAGGTVCWDAGRAWYRSDDGREVKVYSDRPDVFETDLDQLAEQLRLTRLLLDAVVLDALIPRLADVRTVGRQGILDPDGVAHELLMVAARAPDEAFGPAPGAPPPLPGDPPLLLDLGFGIDAGDGTLWSLAVRAPHRPDLAPLELVFAFHGTTPDGLLVPGNIKVFRAGEPAPVLQLAVHEDPDGHVALRIDPPLDEALFAAPDAGPR